MSEASKKSSFYWALRLMPVDKRAAMFAIYRYCRALDDVVDNGGAAADQLGELDAWSRDVGALFSNGAARIPAITGLDGTIARFGLEREPLDALIEGMRMDVRGEMRAPSLKMLENYCYCVAGAVGLLAVKVFEAEGSGIKTFALALGDGLQMTNILRDIEEDAARDRLYLPREHLDAAGIETDDPARIARHPALPQACAALADLAESRYRAAHAAMPGDPRALRPAIIMMSVYRRLLQRLRQGGWADPRQATRVPEAERLWIALRHMGPPATWPPFI